MDQQDEKAELLMVLQGTPNEYKTWAVPSGGKESHETFKECCIREVWEETGYIIEALKEVKVKKDFYEEHQLAIEAHYFLAEIVGGGPKIQDPDNLIYYIAWKSIEELKNLELSFPEDRGFLLELLQKKRS